MANEKILGAALKPVLPFCLCLKCCFCFCLCAGRCLSEKLETHIPDNVISGCLKAKVSVSGKLIILEIDLFLQNNVGMTPKNVTTNRFELKCQRMISFHESVFMQVTSSAGVWRTWVICCICRMAVGSRT